MPTSLVAPTYGSVTGLRPGRSPRLPCGQVLEARTGAVGAADRIGLLFDITLDVRLDVHLAKVATYGARVVDAFYVRDVLGRTLDDEQVAELDRALALCC